MQYFEAVGSGYQLERGLCSDNNCPCKPETVIPHGTGYLYISQEVVDFRRDALSRKAAERKAQEIAKRRRGEFGFAFVHLVLPHEVLVCEQGARLRNLDLEIAAADARTWWKTGKVPLRATPLAGSEAARKAREILRSEEVHISIWKRLFGKKADSPVQPGVFNPPVADQWPSATKPPQPIPAPPKLPATTSQGITTLLEVCSYRRERLISLEEDPTFNQAVEELKREGPKGAQALAALIDELLAARCAEILDALAAASRLPPQPELINSIQKIISAPPVIVGQPGIFTPVIIGGGRIGWDDGTAARIKEQASEVLATLGTAPEATAPKVSSPQSMAAPAKQSPPAPRAVPVFGDPYWISQARPAKESPPDPWAVIVACTKCNRQYHLGVNAAVVTWDGVLDDFASRTIVVGSTKGSGPDTPDLIAPLPAGQAPTQNTLKEVARLQRVRAVGAARYWQCHLCQTVFPYPWVRGL